MDLFQTIGILLCLAAVLAYLNHRWLKLPTTIGLMALALLHAVGLLVLGQVQPEWIKPAIELTASIDFNKTLMQGMLGYLLFAGALHVNLSDLRQQTWVVLLLASVGVMTTTVLVGVATMGVSELLGLGLPWIYCFLFGALIAPTDPIAVLAIMKKVGAPKSVETKLAGESLFNDGVGVVVFLALMGIAGLGGQHQSDHHEEATHIADSLVGQPLAEGEEGYPSPIQDELHADVQDSAENIMALGDVAMLFILEAGGGIIFGLALGGIMFFMLRSLDDYKTEVLITLAGVTGGYALAAALHVSGPLAMVMAGLILGNHGRRLAMSETTIHHLDTFWELIDEILNAILFVLIGLEVLIVSLTGQYLLAGAILIPLVLLARFLAVGSVLQTLRLQRTFTPHAIKILTWAGLRGGISIALALSLKGSAQADSQAVEILVTMTYVIVAFSILVQGLTIAPLLQKTGVVQAKD